MRKSGIARARGHEKAHALAKMERIRKTANQKTETHTAVAERLVAAKLAALLACNRRLDFEEPEKALSSKILVKDRCMSPIGGRGKLLLISF